MTNADIAIARRLAELEAENERLLGEERILNLSASRLLRELEAIPTDDLKALVSATKRTVDGGSIGVDMDGLTYLAEVITPAVLEWAGIAEERDR